MNIDYPFHFDRLGRTATTGYDDHVRDMIEQLVRGKDPIRLDRDPLRDFREPGTRQLTFPFAKANRERGSKRTVVGDRVRWQRALT